MDSTGFGFSRFLKRLVCCYEPFLAQAFELLRSGRQRSDYLLTKQVYYHYALVFSPLFSPEFMAATQLNTGPHRGVDVHACCAGATPVNRHEFQIRQYYHGGVCADTGGGDFHPDVATGSVRILEIVSGSVVAHGGARMNLVCLLCLLLDVTYMRTDE